jgi:transcriptional regulator with XRE-family HTH domain
VNDRAGEPKTISGGLRLKQAIHQARAVTDLTSDTALSLRAGVHYDTLMNWYSERTVPRPAELKKVADALGVRMADLMDVYEGRDPRPPSLEEAIGELVDELRVFVHEARLSRVQQDESTSAILRALGAIAHPARGLAGTPSGSAPGPRPDTSRR